MNPETERARLETILASLAGPLPDWERQTVLYWTSMIGRRDPFYLAHVANVCEWSLALGKALGIGSAGIETLVRGSLVHDIGKVDVPAPILAKPGPLTDAERAAMQNYCIVGQQLVESLPSFHGVGSLVRSHHEKLDGSGYPDGLKREAMSIELRILTVADVFDAVRSQRVYKSACSDGQALATLLVEAERNWLDAEVVAALKDLLQRQAESPAAVPSAGSDSHPAGEPTEDRADDGVEVLIVEDNRELRKMTAMMVQAMGLRAHTADNGRSAIALLRCNPRIGVVLLDIMMPEMDGFAFCRDLQEDPALRERVRNLHIIIVSARTNSVDKIRALELGAADYLTKPFDSRELQARISVGERLVRQQRVLEEHRSLLEEMVRVEPLTGLCSRRFFEQMLRQEWERACRYRHPVSLIMADLDRFKQINDRYGHGGGDRVLSRVGELLRRNLRQPDMAARYGGEEFVLLLPETGGAGAREVAERLRQTVKREVFRLPEGEFHVTMSCGVATAEDACQTRADELLDASDRALYRAKLAGRDRITW